MPIFSRLDLVKCFCLFVFLLCFLLAGQIIQAILFFCFSQQKKYAFLPRLIGKFFIILLLCPPPHFLDHLLKFWGFKTFTVNLVGPIYSPIYESCQLKSGSGNFLKKQFGQPFPANGTCYYWQPKFHFIKAAISISIHIGKRNIVKIRNLLWNSSTFRFLHISMNFIAATLIASYWIYSL